MGRLVTLLIFSLLCGMTLSNEFKVDECSFFVESPSIELPRSYPTQIAQEIWKKKTFFFVIHKQCDYNSQEDYSQGTRVSFKDLLLVKFCISQKCIEMELFSTHDIVYITHDDGTVYYTNMNLHNKLEISFKVHFQTQNILFINNEISLRFPSLQKSDCIFIIYDIFNNDKEDLYMERKSLSYNEHINVTVNAFQIVIVSIFSPIILLCIFIPCIIMIFIILYYSDSIDEIYYYFSQQRKVSEKLKKEILVLEVDDEEEKKEYLNLITKVKVSKDIFKIPLESIRLLEEIGRGKYSTVYKALCFGKKVVAFKIFKSERFLTSQQDYEDFQREVKITASLDHPNIIKMVGGCYEKPRLGIILEYCQKGDLIEFILENKGRISMRQKVGIFENISSGMEYLHCKNIIHRDLKSSNVLVTGSRSKCTAKLCDFGLTKFYQRMSTRKTKKIGTSYYMAPEVTRGVKYDTKCDVFSFSIVMFEVLTENFNPFGIDVTLGLEIKISQDEKFRPVFKNERVYPTWLVDTIKKCWSNEPKKRPPFSRLKSLFARKKLKFKKEKTSRFGIYSPMGGEKLFFSPQREKLDLKNSINVDVVIDEEEKEYGRDSDIEGITLKEEISIDDNNDEKNEKDNDSKEEEEEEEEEEDEGENNHEEDLIIEESEKKEEQFEEEDKDHNNKAEGKEENEDDSNDVEDE